MKCYTYFERRFFLDPIIKLGIWVINSLCSQSPSVDWDTAPLKRLHSLLSYAKVSCPYRYLYDNAEIPVHVGTFHYLSTCKILLLTIELWCKTSPFLGCDWKNWTFGFFFKYCFARFYPELFCSQWQNDTKNHWLPAMLTRTGTVVRKNRRRSSGRGSCRRGSAPTVLQAGWAPPSSPRRTFSNTRTYLTPQPSPSKSVTFSFESERRSCYSPDVLSMRRPVSLRYSC